MYIDFLLNAFRKHADREAIVWKARAYSYHELFSEFEQARRYVGRQKVKKGEVVTLEGDFSPRSVAILLALVERGCIIVPIATAVEAKKKEFRAIAQAERVLAVGAADDIRSRKTGAVVDHPLLLRLRSAGHPGLVIFSSGSTGASKAAVHDFAALLEKFKEPGKSKRMITFLLFDHIGGVNTLFHALSNGGCLVTVEERTPAAVVRAIQDFRVQVLPVTPTFMNLLLLSEAYRGRDMSSLEFITYGTEPMPEATLKRTHELFPKVKLQQMYGLSELGIMRSKSKSSDSLWVKVGGSGMQTRVVDGLLEIKSQSAMLGYLNAESPFTEDGWLRTGDLVEVDGEYLRILGRKSEMINVGGEKVYPAEVESAISEMPDVEEVVVGKEPNPIMGNVVTATVRLKPGVGAEGFKQRLQLWLRGRLEPYKIPQRVILGDEPLHSDRFKKKRVQS